MDGESLRALMGISYISSMCFHVVEAAVPDDTHTYKYICITAVYYRCTAVALGFTPMGTESKKSR